MEYYFFKTIPGSFDNAVQKITEALKSEGFGILTEIASEIRVKSQNVIAQL